MGIAVGHHRGDPHVSAFVLHRTPGQLGATRAADGRLRHRLARRSVGRRANLRPLAVQQQIPGDGPSRRRFDAPLRAVGRGDLPRDAGQLRRPLAVGVDLCDRLFSHDPAGEFAVVSASARSRFAVQQSPHLGHGGLGAFGAGLVAVAGTRRRPRVAACPFPRAKTRDSGIRSLPQPVWATFERGFVSDRRDFVVHAEQLLHFAARDAAPANRQRQRQSRPARNVVDVQKAAVHADDFRELCAGDDRAVLQLCRAHAARRTKASAAIGCRR